MDMSHQLSAQIARVCMYQFNHSNYKLRQTAGTGGAVLLMNILFSLFCALFCMTDTVLVI